MLQKINLFLKSDEKNNNLNEKEIISFLNSHDSNYN